MKLRKLYIFDHMLGETQPTSSWYWADNQKEAEQLLAKDSNLDWNDYNILLKNIKEEIIESHCLDESICRNDLIKIKHSINNLVEYLYINEVKHYDECNKEEQKTHIFNDIKKVEKWINQLNI